MIYKIRIKISSKQHYKLTKHKPSRIDPIQEKINLLNYKNRNS